MSADFKGNMTLQTARKQRTLHVLSYMNDKHIWYQRVAACECAVVGEKAIPIKRGHCPCLLHGPQHHLPFCLPLSFLWALQPHLRTPESNSSNDHFQVMKHWVSARGWGLTWIQRIDRFSNHWMQMIPHCQRNPFPWNISLHLGNGTTGETNQSIMGNCYILQLIKLQWKPK